MLPIKFYPEKRIDKSGHVKTKMVPLFLSISLEGKRLNYFTGLRFDLGEPTTSIINGKEKVTYSNWVDSIMRVQKSVAESQELNNKIIHLETTVRNAEIETNKKQGIITLEYIKQELDKLKGKKKETDSQEEVAPKITVIQALDEWIKNKAEKEAKSTLENTKSFIRSFIKYINKDYKEFSFKNVDDKFYADYIKYLRVDRKQSVNTESKQTQFLGSFFRFCESKGYTVTDNHRKFEITSEIQPDIITINETEIRQLEDVVLDDPKLELVRNLFLFQCYCGMRFGDVQKLKKSDVKGNHIRFFISKNRKGVKPHTVPLSADAIRILELYKDLPGEFALPQVNNPFANRRIKKIAKLAGLDEATEKKKIFGNDIKIIEGPKHKFISTHFSRKGFITSAISKNIHEQKIKAITGHKPNSVSFARYFTVSLEDKMESMDEIWKK